MFTNKIITTVCVIISLCITPTISASGQFNWLRPYDTLLVPDQYVCKGLQLTTYVEFGVKDATGFNVNGDPTNVLTIWDCNQDALAMLNGFPADSIIGQKNIEVDAFDNGVRGHFDVCGKLYQNWALALSARYFFWENLCLGLYLPFYSLELKSNPWQDLTQDNTAEDLRVKELLTNDIYRNVCQLGSGLNLRGWKRTGPGDLVALIEFFKDYPQRRPMLKNVGLHGRVGFNFPTGVRQNEDLTFAVPFGYDGATGFFGAGGFDILISDVLECGVDVELLHLFGTTKQRRIKTDVNQTELLLLEKLCTYKDNGLVQRFNLYAQIIDLLGPVSLKVGYQFFKQDDSEIAFSDCTFPISVANTAKSLQEWTMHHIFLIANYDFSYYCKERWYNPYVSAYARIPLHGRNIALIPTVGAVFAINF